ncbi:MAG TPA: TIGR03546 family protein [Lacipirellulaceae bacterium]|jgi:uncharacterized protein (TIGR03546 family)|nr:TIGR03546 family protein [Lacipirellulaceae bacterium]
MFSDALAMWRTFTRSLVGGTSPSQLAAGFTLGMIIGIVPKANLIALALCVLLFSLRCNKVAGVVAAIAFSYVGHWIDPFSHKLGLAVLSIHPLQGFYSSAFNLPLGPWLGFNNTVVMGSLLLGLYVAYPVFWLSRQVFVWLRPTFANVPRTDSDLQPGAAA